MTVLVLFGFGFVITTSNAAVGINSQLNYQGKMTDSLGGTVANTAWNFRFRIYDAPTGGNLLWTERWTSTSTQVSTISGIFSVTLGSLNSLSSVDFNSDSLYLQVHIDADSNGTWEEEFDTRKRLTAAAYAFNADEIDGINATSTNAVANYLLSLDSYGNLNLFNQGVSSTYATTSWLYVREDVQIDGNATTSGSLSAAEYYINGDKIISIDGTYNLMVGYQAYTNTGNYSTIIGSQAGANNVSNYLTAIGHTAGSNNSGSYVTVAGEGAGFMNSGIGLTGFGAYAGQENTGLSATVIGSSAGAKNTGNNLSVLGASAAYNNTGNNVTALGVLAAYGDSSANPYNNIIALGYNAKPTANNQLVVGDHSGIAYITDGYFGSGVTSTSPYAFTFHGSGGWGGDTAGADLRVVGGYGNGAGLDGNVILAHDGTTSVGKVGVGTTTIPALLTVSGNFVDNGVMLRVYQDFLSSGTVGYGHSTATEFLYGESGSIGGGLAIGVKKESSGSHDILVAHHAGNDIFKVTDGLQVGINTTTPWAGYNLAVDGSSIFIGDLIANTALGVATTTPWSGYQFAVAGNSVFAGDLYNFGNATTSGSLWVSDIATLATTTMAYDSSIGGLTVSEGSFVNGVYTGLTIPFITGVGTLPISATGIVNLAAIVGQDSAPSIYLFDDTDEGTGNIGRIIFTDSEGINVLGISSVNNSGDVTSLNALNINADSINLVASAHDARITFGGPYYIEYSTSTDIMSFIGAGQYSFDNDLLVLGNATSSHFAADEFCLNNDCITSWPIGSSAWELYSSDPLQITPTTTGAGLYVTGTSTFTSQINLADNKSININDDSQLEINMSPESSFILTEKEITIEGSTLIFPYLRGIATGIEGEESANAYILALDASTAFYQSDPAETQVQISFLSSDLINQSSIMYDWGGTSPYFEIGDDLSVSGNVSITGNATSSHFAADEFCLNNDCITSWPIGSSGSSAWELYSSDPLQITPTTTGAGLYVTGTSTLATTTMAFDSKIGNENDYWSVELLDFGAWGNFPLLKPYSPTSIFGNRGMINSALIVMEDINGTSWNPRITFSNNDPTFGIWNVSDIVYNTTTDSMSFESASGGYSFDNNLKITGNATTSGWFNIGTTDVINLLGSRIGAGDLYVGRNATTTGNFTVGTSTLVIKHDTNSIAKIGINTTTPAYGLVVNNEQLVLGPYEGEGGQMGILDSDGSSGWWLDNYLGDLRVFKFLENATVYFGSIYGDARLQVYGSVTTTSNIYFNEGSNHVIEVATASDASESGYDLTVKAGAGNGLGTTNGGELYLYGGAANNDGTGGHVYLYAGDADDGISGDDNDIGGNIYIEAGSHEGSSGSPGDVYINGGVDGDDSSHGDVLLASSRGNVGINDTTPSYKLDVNGTGRFTGVLTVDSDIVMSASLTGMRMDTSDGADTEVLALSGGGSIEWLDDERGGQIFLYGNDLSGGFAALAGDVTIRSGNTANADISFETAITKRMIITSAGNIGIGLSNPGQKLDVIGNASSSLAIYAGTNMYVGQASAADDDYIYFDNAGESLMWDDSPGEFIFSDDLRVSGFATVTSNLHVSGYASTTNLVLADGGSNLGTYYDLYVNSGELFFNGTQISGLSSGSSFWNYLPGMEKAISPTSTDIGIYVTASSTIAANFRVDGNSTTTGHFTVGSTLYVKDGNVSLGLATTSDLFRVGTSTQSGMLVVDKTSGWIGIGTNDPAFKFDMPDYSAAGNARIGAAELGSLPAGGDAAGLWAYFGNQNLDHSNSGNYALLQDYLGNTTMNAASNQGLRFNINNVTLMSLFGDSTLSIATSTTRGQIFVSMINSGYNVSGFNATTTYISVGRNLVSSVRNEIYLGTGGAGANVYLSSGGPGMDVFGSANGGNAGNIYLAQGGTPGSGTYGNDGTITIGNSDSGAKRNAHVNIYGSIDALTGGITTNLTLGGNIIFSAADARIMKDTSDGSDNEYISIAGGGDSGPTRGAYVQMFGNEVSGFSLYGKLILAAGDTSNGGDILFSTQSKYPMIIDYNGNVAIGNGSTGVLGISPGQTLEVYGNASTTGNFYATGDLYIGHNVTSDDDYIYFDNAGESLMWDDSPGEFIFSDDLRVSGFATVTSNLHVSGYASTTNLVLADGGSNLGTYYDLYVNNGNLFFNGSQLTGASGLSFWNYLPGLNGAISPTSTNSGIYITASSTVAADFRVDGNATTTGHFEAGSTLYVKDNMVGIGIDPTALVAAGLNENALTSYKVYTNTSGANYTNYFATRIEPTAQSSAINYGITNSLTVDALENVDFAIGLNSSVNHGGQASLDGLITIQAQAELSDSGSVTTTQVIAASVVNGANDADGGGDMDTAINFYGAGISLGSNAGTVTNFYNMYLSEPLVGAGSLTNAYGIYIQNYAATATTLNYPIWTNDGQVRFDNTNTGTTTLYVTGDSYFNGNATTTGKLTAAGVYNETTADAANVFIDSNGKLFRSTSSLKYKTDINYQGIDGNLVYQLQPASYKDRNSGIEYIGFVAEDVNLVEPRLVLYDDQGNPDALHYGQFSALIVAGLKDLKSEVDDLKLQISDDNLNSITSELLVIDNPDLNINTLVVQQAATFYGTLYVQGEAGFMHKVVFEDDVEIKGKLYVDKDQAGTVKIPAGATSTEVIFEKEYKTTPKVVATLNSLVDIKYAIVEKSPFGFRLAVLEPADQEVTFDWIALATTELANEDEEANQEEEIIDETVNVEIPETSANLIKDFSISDDSIVQGDLVELQVTLEEGVENYNIAWLKNIESGEISGTGLVSHFGGTALTNTANVTVYVIISTEEGIDVASKVINIVVPETVEPVIVGPPSPSGDEPVEAGCTDQTALNYNPSANEDNGTCEYEPVAIEPMATTTDGVGGSNPWSP